jgi:hypothetical protein
MEQMDIERMAENFALSTYLTEWDELTYDEIMEDLNNDELPDLAVVWQPFEDYSPSDLMSFIEILRNDFLVFADKVRGI